MRGSRKSRDTLIPLFLGLLLMSGQAYSSGTIAGKVVDPSTSKGAEGVTIIVCREGRSQAIMSKTDGDGSFQIENLEPGRYTVAGQGHPYLPVAITGDIEVKEGERTSVELRPEVTYSTGADSWLQWHREFGQTFKAQGGSLTSVTIKAFSPDALVRVTIHKGGPSGPQVGPARTTGIRFGSEGTATVRWPAGEIPTNSGETFFVRMTSVDDAPWAIAVDGRGDTYPDGQSWFDGIPHPDSDVGIWVVESAKDKPAPVYALSAGYHAVQGQSFGQTFRVRGKSILMAALPIEGIDREPHYLRFSLHRGGPWGEQIGPSKSVRVDENFAVTWLPGEVDLGGDWIIYLHVERFGGGIFRVFVEPDACASGCAFIDGIEQPGLDLAAWIYGGDRNDEPFIDSATFGSITLVNPSFEEGAAGWNKTVDLGGVVESSTGIRPPDGAKMFGWTSRGVGVDQRTQITQTVKVYKDKWHRFTGKVYTNHKGGRSSDVKIRVIVQTRGETDFKNDEALASSQWFATEGEWIEGGVTFRAESDTVRVGFDLEQRWPLEQNDLYVDDAKLENVSDPR